MGRDFLLALLLALSPQSNDWLVVPGLRAGPVTAKTTHADLIRLFGKTNVKEDDVCIGDECSPGTIVFADRPDATFMVGWKNPEMKTDIFAVYLCSDFSSKACVWHTAEGITRGTSLTTLERLNGGPFTMLAFETDAGGTVLSWRGGLLGGKGLWVELSPRPDQTLSKEAGGGGDLSSSDPFLQTLNPTVTRISTTFSKERNDRH